MKLRPYQEKIVNETELQWALGNRVVLISLATGGGKTPILSTLISNHAGYVAAIAHRDKLVEQMSMTLARAGVRHDLIASEKTKKLIARKHVKKLGQCFYTPGARVRVASVQTLARAGGLDAWAAQVTLWIVDEGHHVLRANTWGKCVAKFTHPACHGLLLTATPGRPDGKGLGSHRQGCNGGPCEGCNDGFADVMVEGPGMRWLIDQGYLCDYDVVCPPTDLVATGKPGASGEYSHVQQRAAARESHILGDIPKHYLKWARGLSGITFCGDIETATAMVASYRELGVTAELITGETDTNVRDDVFDRAERGELNQIVAVDVISEGVDIPALQVGSFGRLTGSIITWRQQLGRLLRPIYAPGFDLETQAGRLAAIAASSKPRALLLDHIGGFIDQHLGPPDAPRAWSLEPRSSRGPAEQDEDEIPRRICNNPAVDCFKPYPRILRECPHCGYAPLPPVGGRSSPEIVDGDLGLMDPAALAILQGRVLDLDRTREQNDAAQLAKRADPTWLGKHWGNYVNNRNAIIALTDSMDRWAGTLHAQGHADHEIQRAFFLTFGVDVLSARGLSSKEALELKESIDRRVNNFYPVT